jgi:hypothetical protein
MLESTMKDHPEALILRRSTELSLGEFLGGLGSDVKSEIESLPTLPVSVEV